LRGCFGGYLTIWQWFLLFLGACVLHFGKNAIVSSALIVFDAGGHASLT